MSETYAVPGVYIEERNALSVSIQDGASAVPVFVGHFEPRAGTPTPGCVAVSGWLAFESAFVVSDRVTVDAASVHDKGAQAVAHTAHVGVHSVRLYFDNGGGACYILPLPKRDDAALTQMVQAIGLCPDITLLCWCEHTHEDDHVIEALASLTRSGLGGNPGRFLLADAQLHDRQTLEFRIPPVGEPSQAAVYFPAVQTTYRRVADDACVTVKGLDAPPWPDKEPRSLAAMRVDADRRLAPVNQAYQQALHVFDAVDQPARKASQAAASEAVRTFCSAASSAGGKEVLATLHGALALLPSEELAHALPLTKDGRPASLSILSDQLADVLADPGQSDAAQKLMNARPLIVDGYHVALAHGGAPDENTAAFTKAYEKFWGAPFAAFENAMVAAQATYEAAVSTAKTALEQARGRLEPAQQCVAQCDAIRAAVQAKLDWPVYVRASAAMAGVYAKTDRERGVFKAPANVALGAVSALVAGGVKGQAGLAPIRVDDVLNDALVRNRINALRYFRGQGHMVWGARTLVDPAQPTWLYVPVRRLFNAAERDMREALRAVVFEPNSAPTWEAVRASLEHYLYRLWQQGALVGASPAQAYFVQLGLNVTMDGDDIRNGRLIVKVGMAPVRPAEFIILQLTQDVAAG